MEAAKDFGIYMTQYLELQRQVNLEIAKARLKKFDEIESMIDPLIESDEFELIADKLKPYVKTARQIDGVLDIKAS